VCVLVCMCVGGVCWWDVCVCVHVCVARPSSSFIILDSNLNSF